MVDDESVCPDTAHTGRLVVVKLEQDISPILAFVVPGARITKPRPRRM
jgi:hypothetical protein